MMPVTSLDCPPLCPESEPAPIYRTQAISMRWTDTWLGRVHVPALPLRRAGRERDIWSTRSARVPAPAPFTRSAPPGSKAATTHCFRLFARRERPRPSGEPACLRGDRATWSAGQPERGLDRRHLRRRRVRPLDQLRSAVPDLPAAQHRERLVAGVTADRGGHATERPEALPRGWAATWNHLLLPSHQRPCLPGVPADDRGVRPHRDLAHRRLDRVRRRLHHRAPLGPARQRPLPATTRCTTPTRRGWSRPTSRFGEGNPTNPRTEMRWDDSYSSGQRMWEADVYIPAGTDGSNIMQILRTYRPTGALQSTS